VGFFRGKTKKKVCVHFFLLIAIFFSHQRKAKQKQDFLSRSSFGQFFAFLHLLGLEAILEVVEERRLALPAAQDDNRVVVVAVVAHVRVEELPLVERTDDLLDEGLRVGLELLDRLVAAAGLLDLGDDVLEVALDVRHVGGLVEGRLLQVVVVDDIDDLLLVRRRALGGRALVRVLVDVRRDAEVLAADLDVLALDDEHAVGDLELDAAVAQHFGVAEEAAEDLHFVEDWKRGVVWKKPKCSC